jgi:hypothetical protein
VEGRIVADHDWRPAGDGEFNPDMEVPTAAAMPVRHLDEHATSDDAAEELLQPVNAFANVCLDVVTMFETVEGDLSRDESLCS